MILVMLTVIGLMLGSFAGASIWRIRARQLVEDEADGEEIDKVELKKLKKVSAHTIKDDRSQCLHCGHQLAWYDLIPLFSWASLAGKCRYCHKPIGWFEPVIELVTASFFVISYVCWPTPLTMLTAQVELGLWLVTGFGLIILFFYDARWFLLPNKIMFPVIGIAAASALLQISTAPDVLHTFISAVIGCVILSGLYFVLYIASKGAWIGFGDIKLGLALALSLADWRLALLTLFLANIIGCIIVLPTMAVKKLTRYSRVPFGPMMIAGWFIAGLWGEALINWYMNIPLGL